jgi:hypothetical protein
VTLNHTAPAVARSHKPPPRLPLHLPTTISTQKYTANPLRITRLCLVPAGTLLVPAVKLLVLIVVPLLLAVTHPVLVLVLLALTLEYLALALVPLVLALEYPVLAAIVRAAPVTAPAIVRTVPVAPGVAPRHSSGRVPPILLPRSLLRRRTGGRRGRHEEVVSWRPLMVGKS